MNTKKSSYLRFVTASSLFDGHDASINMFRRLFQKAGIEVIHLGHNRSVQDIVTTAIQEDADAICVSSYQGGHMEFFKYMVDLLKENEVEHIKIFGGGGGTILPEEIEELHKYGVTRLYHAEDSRKLGLDGVIGDIIEKAAKLEFNSKRYSPILDKVKKGEVLNERELGRIISLFENDYFVQRPETEELRKELIAAIEKSNYRKPVILGITGPGGAGKSSLTDELINRFLYTTKDTKIGILAYDPSKRKTGGALLGDRIRMNSIYDPRVYVRSIATHGQSREVGGTIKDIQTLYRAGDFDMLILETSGIGQGDSAIVDFCDKSIYVMTSEYGAATQLEKIDMIDFANLIAINKFDKRGAEDALMDVRLVYARSHDKHTDPDTLKTLPVFGTTASSFNDNGVNQFFSKLMDLLRSEGMFEQSYDEEALKNLKNNMDFSIIPPDRQNYLAEISKTVKDYKKETQKLQEKASELYKLKTAKSLKDRKIIDDIIEELEKDLGDENIKMIEEFDSQKESLQKDEFEYEVRGRKFSKPLFTTSLSDKKIPKIATASFMDWGDKLKFMRSENYPGHFPFTSGVFPLKNDAEDPKRQFAGEGGPGRTNRRFHYLSKNDTSKRLSTAYDSVTLYGEDPAQRPDIYGKIGNSGVSVATLDDMITLFDGFDLTAASTSVSHTINGPAPMILAMYFNAAINNYAKEKLGKTIYDLTDEELKNLRDEVLPVVRGTVQADILKEEQAQNTCIFSSPFALKMMGDIQEYFIKKNIRNFYSVSISGYHIAEAGANPITQLALTMSNAFSYVEYYLSRGMDVNDFAKNLSFFFSNGMDPEYSVIGRVARRIWAIAMKYKYGADTRGQKLKYHIQTSGRSLHAQEIAFNDIRTTLQALLAINDNCNSLHTNAYDEAITTPTEESVRRAMAIQLVILKEFGMMKCENATQGSFYIDYLTDLVEEAVLNEFESLSRRGGVLGAMEHQYQRNKIQTESMKYEIMKAHGDYPIIGVNTFLSEDAESEYEETEVVRATEEEKQDQIKRTQEFIKRSGSKNQQALDRLQNKVLSGENIFEELMDAVRYCSLGQITNLLYKCGGQYRRSM